MRRREFITLLGSAAAWPFAARAQQPALPVIGYIGSSSAEVNVKRVSAFRKGLGDTGFVEGRNVTIEFRWAQGREERMPDLVADLIRRGVAVIATPANTAGALAAKAATSTIPIVFGAGGDPVELGLVDSMNRPGGNVTGVDILNVELTAKRLGLLRELAPRATRLAALTNPTSVMSDGIVRNVQASTSTLGLPVDILRASSEGGIDAAFRASARGASAYC
jgi:putative ABC transport system substrate-binding protein